jgi:hypothetical protein
MLLSVTAICFWLVVGILQLVGRHHVVETWLAIGGGLLTAVAVLTYSRWPGPWGPRPPAAQ